MKIYIRSLIIACGVSSSFAAPWGGGSVNYNPMGGGFLTGPRLSAPAFYNPGPGNLTPAFSYTQQQTLPPQNIQSNLSEEAKKVIGKWTLMVDRNRETPTNITSTSQIINKDRQTLNEGIKAGGVSKDDMNSVAQIQMLLNLAEIRRLTRDLQRGQQSFPATYEILVGAKPDPNNQQAGPLSREWYVGKRDKLRSLLTKFNEFLSRNPQFAGDNAPELLVGLNTALKDGLQALKEYEKFCNCFNNPNLTECKVLAQQNSRGDGEDLEDYEDEGGSFPYRQRYALS